MTNSEIAKKHIETMLKESLEICTSYKTKKTLTDKYRSDTGLAESYHGRELLELIQNADDAYVDSSIDKTTSRDVLIEYKENVLRISNRGSAFNKKSVETLSQGNASGKGIQYIGNKGIGFRSILNWAKEVRIYSGDYSFGFSKKFAEEKMDYLKNNFPNIQDEVETNSDISFPVLWAPYWVETNQKEPNYDTTIEIAIDPSTQNDEWKVQNQIDELDANILLFMQNITKIFIKTESKYYSLESSPSDENGFHKIQLRKKDYNNTQDSLEEQSFYVFKREDEKKNIGKDEKVIKISVAIPCDFSTFESNFYTFFPIKNEKCPVPALLHATFLLEQNRSTIQNNKLNNEIFEKLMDFYVDIVTKNFTKKEYGNAVAKLLTPNEFTGKSLCIQQHYMDLCREKLSLLNVNEKFIALKDCPRIYSSFPSFFKGENFDLLCKAIEDSKTQFFLNELLNGNCKFSATEIKILIDSSSEQWECNQRIECFKWWLDNFKNNLYIPKLLKDQEKKWITSNTKDVFFPPSDEMSSIPQWHNALLLNRKDATEIERIYKEEKNDKREIIIHLTAFKVITFREYSADSLINPLKNSINKNYNRAVEFIKWVRKNNKLETLTNTDVIFPCSDRSVHSASNIYLGEAYEENPFIPFLKAVGKAELCNPQTLYYEGENDENNTLKMFLNRFKFAKAPKIIEKDLVYRYDYSLNPKDSLRDGEKKYLEYGEQQLNKAANIDGESGERRLSKESAITIENIYDILEKMTTIQILKWIFDKNDESRNICNNLLIPERKSIVYYKWKSSLLKDRNHEIETKNFLWYAFSFTPWITLGQSKKKYAPSECKFASRNTLESVCLSEIITDEYLKKTSEEIGISIDQLRYLFTSLGCNSNYLNLSPKSFYNLLFKLPTLENISESIKLSHSIYNNCIDALRKGDFYVDKYRGSEDGAKFKEAGMLLTKNEHSYKPAKEIFFSSSSVLNPLRKHLLDVPLKNGRASAIEEIFKVSPYNIEWEKNINPSEDDTSTFDEDFQKMWRDYVPFVLSLLVDSQQIAMIPRFQKLQLHLISNLRDDNGNLVELESDEYHLVEDENKSYFIYVGNRELNKFKLSLAIGELLQKLLTTENTERINLYSELFRSDDNSRKGLIQQHGYIDSLEDCVIKFSNVGSENNSISKYLAEKNVDINSVKSLLDRLYAGIKPKVFEQEHLFKLLKENNLDISDLKSVSNQQNITIVDYNRKRLKQKFEEHEIKNAFEWALWISSANGTEEKRLEFRNQREILSSLLSNEDVDDSVSFDPEKNINQFFEKIFGVARNEFDFSQKDQLSYDTVDDIYSANRNKLSANDVNKLESFLDNPKMKSLLYFDVALAQEKYEKWCEEEQQKTQDEPVYKSLPKELVVNYGEGLNSSSPHYSGEKKGAGNRHPRKPPKQNPLHLQNQGDLAELLVVRELRQNKIFDIKDFFKNISFRVEWKSKAAERIEGTDGDDTLGYDICLTADDGSILYIDVKSHEENDCSFRMSANEINFAKDHLTEEIDEYRIIFVSNFKLDSEKMNPSINVLPKDFLQNPNYEIEYPNVRVYHK